MLVFVVPSGVMKDLCKQVAALDSCSNKIILSCTKGFDTKLGMRMSQIISTYLPNAETIAVLSGPNLAGELAKRQPGATVIACKKSYNNTRVRGVAQLGRALPWGGRGR